MNEVRDSPPFPEKLQLSPIQAWCSAADGKLLHWGEIPCWSSRSCSPTKIQRSIKIVFWIDYKICYHCYIKSDKFAHLFLRYSWSRHSWTGSSVDALTYTQDQLSLVVKGEKYKNIQNSNLFLNYNFIFFLLHTRMPIIKRVGVCFMVLLCLLFNQLRYSKSYSTSRDLISSLTPWNIEQIRALTL